MFNKQLIMNLASRILSPQKLQVLNQAYETANNILNFTQNPQEALEKAGVTRADLENAKKYINHPLSGFIIKALGGDKDQIMSGLSRAESVLDTRFNSPTEQAPVGELEALQKNLAKLK